MQTEVTTARSADLDISILGPMRIRKNGHPLTLGPWKQQIVLAGLLCHPNFPVHLDSLIDALWPDDPPRTARKNIQVYVSALRQLLGPARTGERIAYHPGGYVLSIDAAELDSLRFARQARPSRGYMAVGQASTVAQDLAAALELWRGPAFAGMRHVPLIEATAERLRRQYLAVFEDWAEAEVMAGDALRVVERIAEVAAQHPLRERLHMVQMTALAQVGRRSEALAVYDDLRQALSRELGIAPGEAVGAVYQSLLRDERAEHARGPGGLGTCCPLPRTPAVFTGREAAIAQLRDVLTGEGARLAVLTGPMGVGKTALAVHAAHGLATRFPDGCLFVRLRADDGTPRTMPEVLSELGSATGSSRWPLQRGIDNRTWQQWLAEHRALVVLDDARRESQVRPLLPVTGDSAVVITARGRLAGLGAAFRLAIPPLSLAEAIELLGRTSGSARVATDMAAAERIAAVTGRLPLAICLAGERLAWLRHVPLREYAARFDTPKALLDELGSGDNSIHTRLAEAVRDLPGPARLAFAKLGKLPEPVFTLAEAATALAADDEATVRVLEALLEASIISTMDEEVVAHAVMYEVPALTYAYARELEMAVAVTGDERAPRMP